VNIHSVPDRATQTHTHAGRLVTVGWSEDMATAVTMPGSGQGLGLLTRAVLQCAQHRTSVLISLVATTALVLLVTWSPAAHRPQQITVEVSLAESETSFPLGVQLPLDSHPAPLPTASMPPLASPPAAASASTSSRDSRVAVGASDPFFPSFHLRPARNWINDPNGNSDQRGRQFELHVGIEWQ
jgi:hypothetical protein